ncbi:MmcQ/YjbR family DNA-binding protein [Catellatospora tritici]|uniref:MmcQ/YjbR family DNA-binding protein n=1 Tax=Catellatospora tritici TaxID=2851566 RepID=UPI001C2D60D7|nr:MmcQ/YjbR family DNA-binding protein [Catellatospora tritici]MBV1853974.1 MmcQ/YjbR family DNA-binding protein [Catellatospora tritici]
MVTLEDVRAITRTLPRTEEALVRDYVKFRVRGIVYASVSPDETIMGFGFPKEERADLVAAEPDKFLLPRESDLRFHWVQVRLAVIDEQELYELVTEAWRMCVPKKVWLPRLGLAAG